jgi:hypothetical protein
LRFLRVAVDEIKNHPFFADVNWKTLLEKPGIFMPRPSDQFDTGYFWGTTIATFPTRLPPLS